MTKLATQVREFMTTMGQEVHDTPQVPADNIMRNRVAFIMEEAFEAMEAVFARHSELEQQAQAIGTIKQIVMNYVQSMVVKVDFPEWVDALGDIDYVVEGARAACGVDGDPIATEIHHANMQKLTGPKVNGKQMKPEGWKPPRIELVLQMMGWKGPVTLPQAIEIKESIMSNVNNTSLTSEEMEALSQTWDDFYTSMCKRIAESHAYYRVGREVEYGIKWPRIQHCVSDTTFMKESAKLLAKPAHQTWFVEKAKVCGFRVEFDPMTEMVGGVSLPVMVSARTYFDEVANFEKISFAYVEKYGPIVLPDPVNETADFLVPEKK